MSSGSLARTMGTAALLAGNTMHSETVQLRTCRENRKTGSWLCGRPCPVPSRRGGRRSAGLQDAALAKDRRRHDVGDVDATDLPKGRQTQKLGFCNACNKAAPPLQPFRATRQSGNSPEGDKGLCHTLAWTAQSDKVSAGVLALLQYCLLGQERLLVHVVQKDLQKLAAEAALACASDTSRNPRSNIASGCVSLPESHHPSQGQDWPLHAAAPML